MPFEHERGTSSSLADSLSAIALFATASHPPYVLANGSVMNRAEVTAARAEAPPWQRYEISDARLIDVGADTAALVYTGKGWREGADLPFVGAMSSVSMHAL